MEKYSFTDVKAWDTVVTAEANTESWEFMSFEARATLCRIASNTTSNIATALFPDITSFKSKILN